MLNIIDFAGVVCTTDFKIVGSVLLLSAAPGHLRFTIMIHITLTMRSFMQRIMQ